MLKIVSFFKRKDGLSVDDFQAHWRGRHAALVATLPFVVYGVLRYLHLVHVRGEGDNPTEVLWRDRPIQISIVLWLVVFLLIVRGKP